MKRNVHLVLAACVAGPLMSTGGVALAADDALPSREASAEALSPRYIVEFEPGAMAVSGKLDHPNIDDIAREVVVEAITDEVVGVGGEIIYDYEDIPFVAVETDDVQSLWALPGVVDVEPEVVVTRTLSSSLDVIDASDTDLDAAIGGTRADGSGVAVAIIDDGIEREHPFFMENGQSRVIAEACFTRGECFVGTGTADQRTGVGSATHHPRDFHGTHVAGIAAGNSQGLGPIDRGVAAAADIVAIQVFNSAGSAYGIDIDRALNWIYGQVSTGALNVVSVNMSLGGSFIYSGDCGTGSTTHTAVANLAALGVTVVVAAGNSGSRTGVSWPACLNNVVPVGSTTDGDSISSFSNIGPQIVSRGVLAPGSGICSSVPQSVLASQYGCTSGTSMAAPHVAGLIALARQASPNASSDVVKSAIRTTPSAVADTRSDGVFGGLPRINAWSAIGAMLPGQGELRGRLYDITTGQREPLESADISVVSSSNAAGSLSTNLVTSPLGDFRLRLPAGIWNAVVSYSNYLPGTISAAAINGGSVVTSDLDVEVRRGGISGVIDQIAGPFSTATVLLTPTGSSRHASETLQIDPLSSDGSFTLSNVRIGSWTLSVVSGEYASDPVTLTVSSDSVTAISGSLAMIRQIGSISGIVMDSLTNQPLSGVVTVVGAPRGTVGTRLPFSINATLGAEGSLAIPNVRSGDWDVTISASNYFDSAPLTITVLTGQTTSATASLQPLPGSISGAVSDPLSVGGFGSQSVVLDENIVIRLEPTVPSPSRPAVTVSQSLSNSGGSFSIQSVVPGSWSLVGSIFGYEDVTRSAINVPSNGVVDVGSFILERRTAVASFSPVRLYTDDVTRLVTINGRHLTGAIDVRFGNTLADRSSITVIDDSQLTVRVPFLAVGTYPVFVTTGLGESAELLSLAIENRPTLDQGGAPPSGGGGGGGGAPSPASQSVAPGSGSSTVVQLGLAFGTVRLNFSELKGPGSVTVTPKAGKPPFDSGGIVLPGYWLDITSSVGDFVQVEVCAPIETASLGSLGLTIGQLRLFHWENNVRKDATTRVDTANNRVCGVASSFSPFAVGALKTARTFGPDRYATSAEISKKEFQSGVPVAYVVTGEQFPDALAAGAAAGRESGPVLLTRFGSLPPTTRTELQRLKPKRVIVVGGPAVISESVVDELRSVVGNIPVERVWGKDRFETSALLSQRIFGVAGGTVYVGSGLGFTEVLSASAAAGRDRAPLLLVPGTGPNAGVPLSVAVELSRLAPTKVVVVGGAALVSPAIVDQLRALLPKAAITQIGGVDAYDTAAKVARTFMPSGTVYVATGAVFADGLAGGAVAASRGYAMVMVPPSGSLLATVKSVLSYLRPQRVVVLGGPAAVGYDIENAVAGYLPS